MAIPKKNLSSPSTSPTYTPGAVMAVKPQNTISDYKRRLDKSYKAPPPVKGKLPKVPVKPAATDTTDKEYQDLMDQYKGNLAKQKEAAFALYKKNRGALESDLNTTRNSLLGQRGTDLEDIAQNYAARGIGRSSGVYKQAGFDYETGLQERLKNNEKTFNQQAQQEDAQQKESVAAADTDYTENLVNAAKRKVAATEAEAPKAKAKPLPQATPKATPKSAPKKQPRLVSALGNRGIY